MENAYALGHVTSVPKVQNLPALFNEGENSQVTGSYPTLWKSVWSPRTLNPQYGKAVCGIFSGLLMLCSCGSLLWMQGLKNDFVRNILWTFEDIHMLVGSNMPIFGGGRYPAVSLRLRSDPLSRLYSDGVYFIRYVIVSFIFFILPNNKHQAFQSKTPDGPGFWFINSSATVYQCVFFIML